MKNILRLTSAFLFLSAAAVSYAQEPPAQPSQPQNQRSAPAPTTLTGCLTKGSVAKTYTLTDQATSRAVTFAGSAVLDNYVNQTVELSGDMVEKGGESTFLPRTIKTIASTCKGKE